MSPTQRALADCKKLGWIVQVVEHWNAFARRRIDLFGVIDLIALDGNHGPLAIQVTAAGSHSARRNKALGEPRLAAWLRSGARFEVWSYGKKGASGKRKLWTLRREQAVLIDDAPAFLAVAAEEAATAATASSAAVPAPTLS